MSEPKQVICVKWGTKYGPDYVNRMYSMVARNLTAPFRFYCITDNGEGIRPEVTCLPLPELGCPHPERTFGKWRKVVLWGSELCGLKGVALFIDLDSVIVGNLDPYFTYGSPDDVILARNWARPLAKLGQTSIFRYPIGRNGHILENFRADPQGIADRFRYEQHYMTHSVKGGIKFWPGKWTKHFRIHCLAPIPFRYFLTARLPRDARVITFPGGPNPAEVKVGKWNAKDGDYKGLLRHLLDSFDKSKRRHPSFLTHLKRFVKPVPWIADNWR